MKKKILYMSVACLTTSLLLCACGKEKADFFETAPVVAETIEPVQPTENIMDEGVEEIVEEPAYIMPETPLSKEQINEWGRAHAVAPVDLVIPHEFTNEMLELQGKIDHIAAFKYRLNLFSENNWYNINSVSFLTEEIAQYGSVVPDEYSKVQIIEDENIPSESPFIYSAFIGSGQIKIYNAKNKLIFAAPFNESTDRLISFDWIESEDEADVEFLALYGAEIFHNNNGELSVTSYELKARNGAVHRDAATGFEYTATTTAINPILRGFDGEELETVVDIFFPKELDLFEVYVVLENGEIYMASAERKLQCFLSLISQTTCPEKEKILWNDYKNQIYTIRGNTKYLFADGASYDSDAMLYYELPEGYTTDDIQTVLCYKLGFSTIVIFQDNKTFIAPHASFIDINENDKCTHICAQLEEWTAISEFLKNHAVKEIVADNDHIFLLTEDGYLHTASFSEWDLKFEMQTLDTTYPAP